MEYEKDGSGWVKPKATNKKFALVMTVILSLYFTICLFQCVTYNMYLGR